MIEEAWQALAAGPATASQTRVDALHPHGIYADFEPPDRIGLVALCVTRTPVVKPMRALSVEEGRRTDGQWALRLSLREPLLRPVFAALCDDIINCTRSGVAGTALAATVVRRLLHWRNLMEQDGNGLGEATLRGLIGELTVLRDRVLPVLSACEALRAWTGPLGTPQDFQMPSGQRLEVKALAARTDQVHINGLGQLDAGADPLSLLVVRLDRTGIDAPGSTTPGGLITGLRAELAAEPEALAAFEERLASVGWHAHPAHDTYAVHVLGIEEHPVGPGFPRLTAATVPAGIADADYIISLPSLGGMAARAGR